MAYVLSGIVGIGYALALRLLSKRFNIFVPAIISLLLVVAVASASWAELFLVNIANTIGFIVWFCVPVAVIYIVKSKAIKSKYSIALVGISGAFSWAIFTQVSRFLGYVFGV